MDILGDVLRSEGLHGSGVLVVPVDATGIRVSIDRTQLGKVKRNESSTDTLKRIVAEIIIERQLDDGPWEVAAGMGIEGGDIERGGFRGGVSEIATESVLTHKFPASHRGKSGFRLRGIYEIQLECKAKVAIEWLYGNPRKEFVFDHHSVAVENTDGDEVDTASTLTLASLTAPGADTLSIAGMSGGSAGGSHTVSSVTRGGTEVFDEIMDNQAQSFFNLYMGSYLAPDADAATTVFVFSESILAGGCVYHLSGVDQDTPITDTDYATANSGNPTLTLDSEVDGLVIDMAGVYDTPTEGAGQTQIFVESQQAGSFLWYETSSYEAGAASVTMSWDIDDDWWLQGAIAIAPAADVEAAGVTATVVVTGGSGTVAKGTAKTAAGSTATVVVTAGSGVITKPIAAAGVTATVAVTGGEGTVALGDALALAGATATVVVTSGDGAAAADSALTAAGVTAAVVATAGEGAVVAGPALTIAGETALVAVTAGDGTAALGDALAAAGLTATVVVTAGSGTAVVTPSGIAAAGLTATVVVTGGDGVAALGDALAAAGATATVVVTGGSGSASTTGRAIAGVTASVVVTAGDGVVTKPIHTAGSTALVAVTGGEGEAAVQTALALAGLTATVVVTAGSGTVKSVSPFSLLHLPIIDYRPMLPRIRHQRHLPEVS